MNPNLRDYEVEPFEPEFLDDSEWHNPVIMIMEPSIDGVGFDLVATSIPLEVPISDEDIAVIIDHGSRHPYDCKCSICRLWWAILGPEQMEDNTWGFGPFTREEFESLGGIMPDKNPEEYYGSHC